MLLLAWLLLLPAFGTLKFSVGLSVHPHSFYLREEWDHFWPRISNSTWVQSQTAPRGFASYPANNATKFYFLSPRKTWAVHRHGFQSSSCQISECSQRPCQPFLFCPAARESSLKVPDSWAHAVLPPLGRSFDCSYPCNCRLVPLINPNLWDCSVYAFPADRSLRWYLVFWWRQGRALWSRLSSRGSH